MDADSHELGAVLVRLVARRRSVLASSKAIGDRGEQCPGNVKTITDPHLTAQKYIGARVCIREIRIYNIQDKEKIPRNIPKFRDFLDF